MGKDTDDNEKPLLPNDAALFKKRSTTYQMPTTIGHHHKERTAMLDSLGRSREIGRERDKTVCPCVIM